MTRWFFLAVASLLGLASLLSGFRPLYLLFFTFLAATAAAYAWSKLQSAGLDIRISALDHYPQAGEPLRLKLNLEERLGLQRWALQVRADDGATAGTAFAPAAAAAPMLAIQAMMLPRAGSSCGLA